MAGKETYYFQHDYNARTDIKIKRLISKHGMAGYGCYWALIEDLWQNENAIEADYEALAFDMHTDPETVRGLVEDFKLFNLDNGIISSPSIERRMEKRMERSEKYRRNARKRWKTDAIALQQDSKGNALKEKERKEKESIKGEKKQAPTKGKPASITEVISYFTNLDAPTKEAEAFWDYFQSNGWKVGGKTAMKDWQAAARNWIRRLDGGPSKERGFRLS